MTDKLEAVFNDDMDDATQAPNQLFETQDLNNPITQSFHMKIKDNISD